MSAKEFPKMLYRPKAGGGISHLSVASEADMPTSDAGWMTYKEAKAAAEPEPAAPTRSEASGAVLNKQVQDLRAKAEKLATTLAAAQTDAISARADLSAANARVGALSEFIENVGKADGVPEEVKAAAAKILAPPARPTPAEVKAERHARIDAKGQKRVTAQVPQA